MSVRKLTIALALMLAAPAARAQDVIWQEAPWRAFVTGSYPAAYLPISMAAGDLDGDGDTDVLVGQMHFFSPGVSVILSRGDGTYLPPVEYNTGSQQSVGQVALADFDGDGDRDAFATIRGANDDQGKLMVWRNNGDGTLAAPATFATGLAPTSLVVADFTGDGKPDAVTANYGFAARSISLLKHNGQNGAAASLQPQTEIPMGDRPQWVAAGDVNRDGKLDLAVTVQPDSGARLVLVLRNDAAGGFLAPVTYESAPGATQGSLTAPVALSDLDNDGDVDLITGGWYDDGLYGWGAILLRRNDGQGTFGAAESYRFPDFVAPPWSLVVGDLNGDGFSDVIASTPSGRTLDGYVVLPSIGSGAFGNGVWYEAEQWTYDVAAFDADRDGDNDVATIAQFSVALTIHSNPGNGGFRVPPRYPVGAITDGFDAADIDNDGDIDVVTNNLVAILTNDAQMTVYKNDGQGVFTLAGLYTLPPPRNFKEIKLRDINGDGFVDVLFAPDGNYPPYNFGSALNNGNGTFAAVVVHPVGSCGDGSIDAFDLDGDGDRDVVLTEEEGCPGGLPRVFVFRNDGNQSFALATVINSTHGFNNGIEGADLNGDGRRDLVTAVADGMAVYPNLGGFSFGPPVVTSARPYKFRLADFNGDGLLDLGMLMNQDEVYVVDVATALGQGGGSFGAPQLQTGSNTGESLRISDDLDVADFNGDGKPDLLTFNYASNDVSVFLNNGTGTLLPQQRYGIGSTPQLGAVADFNGDGRPDIAASIGLPPLGWESAMVVIRSVSITPTALAVDAGGNSVLEPGEVAVMGPSWRNGSPAALAITGAASNFTGPAGGTYTVVDASADYGTIPANGTGSCTDCYSLTVGATVRPALHWDATVLETLQPTDALKTWRLHIGDSFTDVPQSSPFYRFVETILHKDVTGGCGPTTYCPSASTSREQMAVFVLRAREAAGYVPAACGPTPVFGDVPVSSPFCPWVEELARRGVASGCGGGSYCPTAAVTREQMAVFVLRTLDPALQPPACGAPMFGDVPAASPFCRWIEELARRSVVTGCGGGNYCPTAPVTREQMSVFLAVTFGLALYGM